MKQLDEILNKLRKRCDDKKIEIIKKIEKFNDEYAYILKNDILNFFESFDDYQDMVKRITTQDKNEIIEEEPEELRFEDKIEKPLKISKIEKEVKKKVEREDDRRYIEDLDKDELEKVAKNLINIKKESEEDRFPCNLMAYLRKNKLKFKTNYKTFFLDFYNGKKDNINDIHNDFGEREKTEEIENSEEDPKFEDFK